MEELSRKCTDTDTASFQETPGNLPCLYVSYFVSAIIMFPYQETSNCCNDVCMYINCCIITAVVLSRLWYDPIQRIADIGNGAVNVSVVWTDSERGSEFCELPPFDIRVSGSGAPFLRPVDAGATVLSLEKAIRYTVQAMPPLLTDGTPVLKRPPPFIIDTS